MQKATSQNWRNNDMLLAIAVLAILLVFTYGILYVAPYPGFYFNPANGEILDIYENQVLPTSPGLQVGDIVEQVGSIPFEEYSKNPKVDLFENLQAGDILDIHIMRNNEPMTIHWAYAGFSRSGFFTRIFNIWWLAYIFWIAGMFTQLFIRPKDRRWLLFWSSSYLTALFIMFGSISSFHIWLGSSLMRFVAWLTMPIYLHFHWIFPHSLRRIPHWLQGTFYVFCLLVAISELILPMPSYLYYFAILTAFGGSVLLLVLHFILQPNHRREVKFLAGAAFTAVFPVILFSTIQGIGHLPPIGPLALLLLPILPGAYFYVLYRSNLGILEIRANRAISLTLFLIAVGIVIIIATSYFGSLGAPIEQTLFIAIVISLISTATGAVIFPEFQKLVERTILGIKLPSQRLSEEYSARIITSDRLPRLLKLLEDEVFPSLLIRQYAFVRNLKGSVEVLLSENVTPDQVPSEALVELLVSSSTGNLPLSSRMDAPLDWIRVSLPLRIGQDLIGLWLLGRRDPDDHYPQAELPILQSLANQTAVALSNIMQTEHLKTVYEANINRYEQERVKLAHDLHDSVLNEMAAMRMKLDPSPLPPEFQASYDELIKRVREIVGDLRPPMLIYGLKFALNGLADNLSERHQDRVQIISELEGDGEWRHPETVEHNIYRIVQEACENALKYSRAKSVTITGELSLTKIDIRVLDDGIGFKDEISLKLDEMLVNKHYGLAGMHERAYLIGASITVNSKPGQGTQVRVTWEPNDSI